MTYIPPATDKLVFSDSEATLANGASIDAGWLDFTRTESYRISVFADVDGLSLVIDSSEIDGGGGVDDVQSTTPLLQSFLATLPQREPYMRFRITNNTGSDVTNVKVAIFSLQTGTGASIFPEYVATAQFTPAMIVRPSYYQNEVALGRRVGSTTWNKFGYNNDVDSASEEIIAEFGGTFNIMTSADTLDVVSSSANDTSAGTGAQSVLLIGIDGNGDDLQEIVVTNGTTPVTTSGSFLGINRAIVLSAGSAGDNVGTITISDTSGTVGTQATIPAGQGVTQQCIFHTFRSHKFLADWLFINVNKLSGGSAPKVTIKGYSYSRVTQVTYEIFRYTIDASVENTVELNPSQPFVLGGREVLYFTADTDTNNTVVNLRFSGIQDKVN